MEQHIRSAVFDDIVETEPLMADPEKLMRLVMETQTIGTWRLDVPSGKVFWSPRVFHIHGLDPSESGVDLDAAINAYHPADAKTVDWLIRNAISNKVGYSFILRLKRKDGGTRLVQSAAAIETDAAGGVASVFGTLTDVTDRLTEKELSDSRARLVRSIISYSPAPLVVLDRALRYVEVSPAWSEHYELPPARELIGKSHLKVMPKIPRSFRDAFDRALKGEIIHTRLPAKGPDEPGPDRVAAIFPWKTGRGEIGGIIIMLTPSNAGKEQDRRLTELATLIGQIEQEPTF